ncbi:Lipase/lipooxygenase, PLAT/LH2 [Artemisia annua]|uniref:Lipase/lipooxygenase, PLAT/LH2 n=1 Tax=Artemisia annua TaxID=35608 RepID=A0A2U1KSG3_ARTAN|nr:Lipase/lipooxygenase, PLAT/LH2 [Artemisia annua]
MDMLGNGQHKFFFVWELTQIGLVCKYDDSGMFGHNVFKAIWTENCFKGCLDMLFSKLLPMICPFLMPLIIWACLDMLFSKLLPMICPFLMPLIIWACCILHFRHTLYKFDAQSHRSLYGSMHLIFYNKQHTTRSLIVSGIGERPLLGMAVPDDAQPHRLRLLIEDYPYANDGLLIWSAIQELVKAYLSHFYPNKNGVISDTELYSWYSEAINVGHTDVNEANWWHKLCTPSKLTEILTILICT